MPSSSSRCGNIHANSVRTELAEELRSPLRFGSSMDPFLFVMARVFPQFKRVRDDPRFADIRRRLRLPD
jgi:hypothetical protein